MPFCPVCGAEYREGFTVCSDCGAALSSTPVPVPGREEAPLALIEVECHPILAVAIRDLLVENDIPCEWEDSGFEGGWMHGLYAVKDRGMLKFLVPESRVTQAREIIEAFLEESEASSGEIICPHCGALVPQWKIICPGCGNNLEQK